jgi:hypothetical protein
MQAPVLLELIRWGVTHDPKTDAPETFIRRIAQDREGMIAEITAAIDKRRGAQ